ncbi:hypothetical protein RBU61_10210 [Tissierella sp. MB52-C2]|uniref:hypothetical protein n=1 Tax=Tissierella sp. MB52-C2 TaxID=3070999 RepID=UPI00280B1A66|nr:hypothetical protein [Tissierella sp. MB52-C2]WMM23329.1 hypothetical protein RBU61_10210 [Tissierella sp. MB52-C2]
MIKTLIISKESFKITTYVLLLNLFISLLFYITDTYIFPDYCGLMLFVPIIILSYFAIGVSGLSLIIMLLLKVINKIRKQ